MRLALTSAIALCLALGSCPAVPATGGDPAVRLHRFTTSERTWSVNAFVLESSGGLVLVDSLFLGSDVRKLAAVIRETGKPLAGILLTHPHVDHAGGVAGLRAQFGPVPVYATAGTASTVVPLFERNRRRPWVERQFGGDYPQSAVAPDHVVADGGVVELAGMRFRFVELGAGEADDNAVIENLDTGLLFTGDATVAHADVYVGEGRSCGTLRGLRKLGEQFGGDRVAYSGHYGPSRLGPLLADNLAQVRWLRERMRAAFADPGNRAPDGALTDAARAMLVKEAGERFEANADYGFGSAGFAENVNLPGLEQEIRAELDAGAGCPD